VQCYLLTLPIQTDGPPVQVRLFPGRDSKVHVVVLEPGQEGERNGEIKGHKETDGEGAEKGTDQGAEGKESGKELEQVP